MNNLLKENKILIGGLSLFLTAVLVLFFTTSCNNLIQVQDKSGSLSIAVPSSRATSSASYTITLTDSNGDIQTKTVPGGQTVTFESLVPDTYAIVVKGENESGNVILYGTSSATVTAGESSSATVELGSVVSTFADLKAAVAEGGTVAVYDEIKVEETLTISQPVTIISAVKNSSLVHSIPVSDDGATLGSIFSITSGGKLILGDGNNSLTVDGNGKPAHGVLVEGDGKLVMKDKVTIQNAGDSGVYISSGTFTMEGGTISDNTSDSYAGGVEIAEGATFDMKGGIITGNIGVNGNGVFVAGKSTFSMSGDAIVESNNDVKLNGEAVITVSGALTGEGTVATITPSSYVSDDGSLSLVLQAKADSGVNLADVVGKFAVTPEEKDDTSTINYAVDGEGKLSIPVTDGASLQAVLDIGGTVSVSGEIKVTNGLTVNNTVTLVGVGEGAKIINNSEAPLFTVSSGGSLTLGNGTSYLTLDGGGLTQCVVNISGGECVLSQNAVITNAKESGVVIRGDSSFTMEGGEISGNMHTGNGGGVELNIGNSTCVFTMNGGTITGNTALYGAGVYMTEGSSFNMNGGTITDNIASDGGKGVGVFVNGGGFVMKGSSVVASNNDVYLNGNASSITVGGEFIGEGIVATITPDDYTRTDPVLSVLQDSGVTLGNVVGKFAVTPQTSDTSTISYTLDGEGKLYVPVIDGASLQAALDIGGTVSVSEPITVTGLVVTKNVTLVAASDGVTLTNASGDAMFTVSSGGSLTLGNGTSSLTLDGGGVAQNVVSISSGGTVTMNDKVTIQNAANSGVYVTGTFNMYGGKITGNKATDGGGVHVSSSGTLNMTGGEISENSATNNGHEVYVSSDTNTAGNFKMGGSATLKGGEVHFDNTVASVSITLTSSLTSNDSCVAQISVATTDRKQVLTAASGVYLANMVGKFSPTLSGYTINDSGKLYAG